MILDPNHVHSTVKIIADSGAKSFEEAQQIAESYILQIAVGPNVAGSPTRQAALLTAVNAGSRAFLGGVRVKLEEDFEVLTPWDRGRQVTDALADFKGVSFDSEFDESRPTVIIGDRTYSGELPLYVTWEGWAGGVVTTPEHRLAENAELMLAGVLGGGLAVSEVFQWTRGYTVATGRDVGISLWAPEKDWRLAEAAGPRLTYLPDNFWLLGLGHLGQANAWAIGFLPFANAKRRQVRVMLQDIDEIVDSNEATSMLIRNGTRGLKTHLAARELERLGLTPLITDRRFDRHTRRSDVEPSEPRLALSGFDSNAPRRLLEKPEFTCVVDSGIGVGELEYLGISVHSFPASRSAEDVFAADAAAGAVDVLLETDAYLTAAQAAVERGEATTLEAAKCGLIDVAGKAAGAAFVGTIAAALAVSEMLRILNGGSQYETLTVNLRTPDTMHAYSNPDQEAVRNPGFVEVEPGT